MKFMKKIFVCVLVFIISLTGCHLKEEKLLGLRVYTAINSNNIQGVKEILETEELNLEKLPFIEFTNFRNQDRRALAFALDNDSAGKEVVKLLVDAGADPSVKNSEGYTVMDEWVCNAESVISNYGGDVERCMWERVELLSKYGGEITPATLEHYLENDNFLFGKQLIDRLNEAGKKIGIKKDLEYAVCGENEKLLNYLESHKVSNEKSVLFQAVAHCNVDVLKKLKEQGCDFTVKGVDEESLAHIAARYNDADALSYVMKQGADPNSPSFLDGYNALTWAAVSANQENVRVLEEAGVRWQREGMQGADVWKYVCSEGTKGSVKLLLDEIGYPTDEETIQAYQNCNVFTVKELLKYKIPYNQKYREPGYDEDEWTTGYARMCADRPELAEKIYEEIPDLEITQEAFENISDAGDDQFIQKVLKDHMDSENDFLETALDDAVYRGKLKLVQKLVEQGADINKDLELLYEEKHTVMHTAVNSASIEIFRYLLANGGDMDQKDEEGYTPVEYLEDCPWKGEYREIQ